MRTMSQAAVPVDERRAAALEVLTTGVVGDDVAERVTWSVIRLLDGSGAALALDDADLDAARSFAASERIGGIVHRVAPGVAATDVASLAGAIDIERRLLSTIDLLEAARVPTLVLKGNATARLDHRSPEDREVGDVDVLVRPEDLTTAMAALVRQGHRHAVTHPFSTSAFFHSETFVHPDGIEIDLHHRLSQPSRPPTSCWADPAPFELGGRTLLALPRPWRFLHALVHQMMNPPPSQRAVNGLTDLVVMWRAGVDLDRVRSAAAEIGTTEIVERGLRRVTDLLGDAPPPPTAPQPVPRSRVERRFAAALDTAGPTPGYLALAANLAVQPVRMWTRYLAELVWPSAAYRRELGITPTGQLRHVVNEALGR